MRRKSFMKNRAPVLTGAVQEETADASIRAIKNFALKGAKGIDLHLTRMDEESLKSESLERIISESPLPIFALDYTVTNTEKEENERIERLLRAFKAGASGIDMQGYSFDFKSRDVFDDNFSASELPFVKYKPKEVVVNPKVIKKQCETIAKKSIADATIALDGELTYNGQKQTQNVTVTLDGFTNVTFDISDNEQTTVKTDGDYTLTVTGTGNFEGTKTFDWNIKPYTPTENSDKKTTARVKRGRTLAEATVTNGEMLGVDGVTALEGTFAWVDDTKAISADGQEQMIFTPNNTNYAPITFDVAVSTYSSSSSSSRYTVKFNTKGGSTVTSQTVKKNTAATEPTEPTKDGYNFDGWYTDSKFTTEYDFDTKVTKNITLYAKWVEDEIQEPNDDKKDDEQKPTTDEWKNPFADVKENDWFFDNVRYANENGLMSGTTDTTFAPNDNLTRGMLVTVLYRAEGEPAVNKSIPFADVNASQYYANAVIWAEQNGIVKGVSETEFAPDENITREQIATIIYRYAKYKGYDVTPGGMQIREFEDFESISDYAINAMTWAVNTGLMKGKTNTTLNPKDFATRAEIAAILNRFIESNK